MNVKDLLSVFPFICPTKLVVAADDNEYDVLWSGMLCSFIGANPSIDWECEEQGSLIGELEVKRLEVDKHELNTLTVYVDGSGFSPLDDDQEKGDEL